MGIFSSLESHNPTTTTTTTKKPPTPGPTSTTSSSSNTYYDWQQQEGGYIPYRFQAAHRRRWRQEATAAREQTARDDAERERNRQVLGEHYYGKAREKGKGGEEEGKGKGKGEKIRVYASPDLEEGWRGGGR